MIYMYILLQNVIWFTKIFHFVLIFPFKHIFILLKIRKIQKINKNCWKLINRVVRLTCWGIYDFFFIIYYFFQLFPIIIHEK